MVLEEGCSGVYLDWEVDNRLGILYSIIGSRGAFASACRDQLRSTNTRFVRSRSHTKPRSSPWNLSRQIAQEGLGLDSSDCMSH